MKTSKLSRREDFDHSEIGAISFGIFKFYA